MTDDEEIIVGEGHCCDDEGEPFAVLGRSVEPAGEAGNWHAALTIEKYRAGDLEAGGAPYETLHVDGNMLLTAGITRLLQLLIGGGGTSYANANARICVGDSSTAAAIGQTDLQAATNKLRKAVDATYPTVSGNVLTAVATFATTDANFHWQEWGIANSASGATLLNRKVTDMGTKTVADTWVATASVTIT